MNRSGETHCWNFAGALQVDASKLLPKGSKVVELFNKTFHPERIRVVLLSPDRFGECMPRDRIRNIIDELMNISCCEVMIVDTTSRMANGLIFVDFFDFS